MILSDWINFKDQKINVEPKTVATVATVATVTIEASKNSNFIETDKNKKLNSKIEFKDKTTTTVATLATVKPLPTYMSQRMNELGLTKEEVIGETDFELVLDENELNDIRNDKQLFDIWVDHVHRHKQLKALELAKKKSEEQYNISDTLDSLPFEHKLKFVEYVLTTFKKFFLDERYKDKKPCKLFVEMWFLANNELTIGQIFDVSAELIRLAKNAREGGDNVEYKQLRGISENAEYFRQFSTSFRPNL